MKRLILAVGVSLFSLGPSAADDQKITGLFGIEIGADVRDYRLVGAAISHENLIKEWKYQVDPPERISASHTYYVTFNPFDWKIYSIEGKSIELPNEMCLDWLEDYFEESRTLFKEHSFEMNRGKSFNGVLRFEIQPRDEEESMLSGNCAPPGIMTVQAFDVNGYRRYLNDDRRK